MNPMTIVNDCRMIFFIPRCFKYRLSGSERHVMASFKKKVVASFIFFLIFPVSLNTTIAQEDLHQIHSQYDDPFSIPSTDNGDQHLGTNSTVNSVGTAPRTLLSSILLNGRAATFRQLDDIRYEPYLDSGSTSFQNTENQVFLDVGLQANIVQNANVTFRSILFQNLIHTNTGKDIRNDESELLEGYLSHYNAVQTTGYKIGRYRPTWSQGYNWTPVDMLYPKYNRPSFDRDDINQQKGWDMVHLDQRFNQWSIGFYLVDVDSSTQEDAGITPIFGDESTEYQWAARLNYESSSDISLILHQLENHSVNFGLTLSRLLSHSISVRMEVARESLRELPKISSLEYVLDESEGYVKGVIGSQISFQAGWDATFEYLYNEHGYTDDEWDQLTNNVNLAKVNLQSAEAAQSYAFLGDSLTLLNIGQLRQHYLYLMGANTRSGHAFQYRQSLQIGLDDESFLHSVELIQNWNEAFSSRFQVQWFVGCRQCEYGILPSNHSMRFSLYYDF